MQLKHLISLQDFSSGELRDLLTLASKVKDDPEAYREALPGKILALVFEKPSTRTRVSFEVAMLQLGGHALFLGADVIQLGRGEPICDTARVLSRYVDGIVARVFAHDDVLGLARNASVPVINGLSDLLHPCQALADYFTLLERCGTLAGLKLAYVGDGNNVCHELIWGAVRLGVRIAIATPKGYEPDGAILRAAAQEAQRHGAPAPEVWADPAVAVSGAHAVYTDVWTSMGQEDEAAERRQAFQGFSVTTAMMDSAGPEAVFMHCLPAHRGEEVQAEVIDGPRSVVFDQAENRLHVQKAILIDLIGGRA